MKIINKILSYKEVIISLLCILSIVILISFFANKDEKKDIGNNVVVDNPIASKVNEDKIPELEEDDNLKLELLKAHGFNPENVRTQQKISLESITSLNKKTINNSINLKEHIYDMLLNTVDNYTSVSGSFSVINNIRNYDYEVFYLSITTGKIETHEKYIDENAGNKGISMNLRHYNGENVSLVHSNLSFDKIYSKNSTLEKSAFISDSLYSPRKENLLTDFTSLTCTQNIDQIDVEKYPLRQT